MNNSYLWLKAFHIIAMVSWMAGMLYLPRLFVYHAGAAPGSALAATFETMERRLELWHSANSVTVDMGEVIAYSWSVSAEVDGKSIEGDWLNTGVPHVRGDIRADLT